MPRVNFPATTAFTTITRDEIQNLLCDLNYVLQGYINDDNLARAIDTTTSPNTYNIIQIPTKKVMDYADESNPVVDTMKFFGTPSTATAMGTKNILFDPIKEMLAENHVYVTDSRTVAWQFTKESNSVDKVERKMVRAKPSELTTAQKGEFVTGEVLLGALSLGLSGINSKSRLVKEHFIRDTSLYTKHAIFEKPKNWIPVPTENTNDDIDNTLDIYNNKIKYTTEFRVDKRLKSDNNDPPPVLITINDPIVMDDYLDFEIVVVAPGMRDTEYVNVELTITVMFEIVP